MRQLLGVAAACVVLFAAGFATGRLTGDGGSSSGDLSATSPLGSADDDDSSLGAGENGDGDETGLDVGATDGGDGSADGLEAVTVEGLQAALATVDHQRVAFEDGTDQLTADGAAAAAEIADILIASPFIPVEVEMHTFTEATPGENYGLSALQAEAVVSALAADGVDPARLAAVGLGGSHDRPEGIDQIVRFASNDTAVDRLLGAIDYLAMTFDDDGGMTSGDEALNEIVDAMATNPSATLDLVGYAYLDDPDTSHDRSHMIIDAVTDRLVAAGLDQERIDLVGLGDTPTQVEGSSEVEFEVGPPAALTLALRQIDESRIQFVSGTADLTPEGAAMLVEVADALLIDPAQRVEISAHSFSEATSAANHALSRLQGETVVGVLVAAGVDAERLELEAHGDPIAFRQANRMSYISFYPLD